MAEEDLAERDAVPGIPLGWPTIAQNDGISIGDWLGQRVGEAEVLARDLVRVEPKIERQLAHDRDLEWGECPLHLVGPRSSALLAQIIQQQQGMHRLRGIRPIHRRERIAGPNGAAAGQRGLPYAVDLVAKPAQAVFLVHAFTKGAENVPIT